MTLDICKLLFNVMNKQMKIQHNEKSAGVYKIEDIPENIKTKITEKFGEDYLGDANILVFFKSGNDDKKSIEKLFKTVDNAFGNDANLLVVGDFKKLSLNSKETAEETSDEEVSSSEDVSSEEVEDPKDDAAEDAVQADEGTETEDSDEKEIQDDIDDVLNEDDDEESDEVEDAETDDEESEESTETTEEKSEPEEPKEVPGEYVFLKITLKN